MPSIHSILPQAISLPKAKRSCVEKTHTLPGAGTINRFCGLSNTVTCLVLARLRSAYGGWIRLMLGGDRTYGGLHETDAPDPERTSVEPSNGVPLVHAPGDFGCLAPGFNKARAEAA